jgi:hypothetical protein
MLNALCCRYTTHEMEPVPQVRVLRLDANPGLIYFVTAAAGSPTRLATLNVS